MQCSHCDAEMDEAADRAATLCMEVMCDEYIDTYRVCHECGWFMKGSCRDRFHGPEVEYRPVAIEPEAGQAIVARIKKCPDPTYKMCDCDAHKSFRAGW